MTNDERHEAFLQLTEVVADQAILALKRTQYAEHWLFFKPGSGEIQIIPRGVEEAPPGFVIACEESIPVTLPSRDHMVAWVRTKTQALPLWPGVLWGTST